MVAPSASLSFGEVAVDDDAGEDRGEEDEEHGDVGDVWDVGEVAEGDTAAPCAPGGVGEVGEVVLDGDTTRLSPSSFQEAKSSCAAPCTAPCVVPCAASGVPCVLGGDKGRLLLPVSYR